MPFCPACRAMLYPAGGGAMECQRCGHVESKVKDATITQEVRAKETVFLGDETATLPTMKVECPKCGHLEAYWILRQTRKSDEPETTILTCTKCKQRWRKY